MKLILPGLYGSFERLEYEQKFCASFGSYFIPIPYHLLAPPKPCYLGLCAMLFSTDCHLLFLGFEGEILC